MQQLNFTIKLIALLFALLPLLAQAVWMEGTGRADIINGDIDTARHKAVQEALLTLMYQGEASVESIQVVKSGVLTTDSLTIRTNGEVHEMQIVREDVTPDAIAVTIRADIFPTQACSKDKYLKTMFVGPFKLSSREHAQLGGLFRIGEVLSERIYRSFKLVGKRVDARNLMTQSIALNTQSTYDIEPELKRIARDLSAQYDVQYIMLGQIFDMSSHNEVSTNLLGVETTTKKRNFQAILYVLDAIKSEVVLTKSYTAQREWPFDVTMKLDVTGETFWNSDYGMAINNILKDIVRDVESAVHCKESIAQVIGFMGDKLVINYGHKNGVKVGDQFKLIRQHSLMSQVGVTSSPIFNRAEELQFTVSEVQSDRALLSARHYSELANVQIRDLLVAVNQRPRRESFSPELPQPLTSLPMP